MCGSIKVISLENEKLNDKQEYQLAQENIESMLINIPVEQSDQITQKDIIEDIKEFDEDLLSTLNTRLSNCSLDGGFLKTIVLLAVNPLYNLFVHLIFVGYNFNISY